MLEALWPSREAELVRATDEVVGNEGLFCMDSSMIRTTSRGHTERRVGVGAGRPRAVDRLRLERRFKAGRTIVFEARRRHGRRLFAGVRRARVRWLGITKNNSRDLLRSRSLA